MADNGLGSIWTLVLPRFDKLFSGDVAAVSPWLVLLIWLVAALVMAFAIGQARAACRWVTQAGSLLEDVEPDKLWARRGEIDEKSMSCAKPVRDAWREFNETLVTDEKHLFSTVPAEEFFNEHRFAPRLVDNRFLHAAPTSLTTLGLLGTFIGLTVGLRGLDLGSTTDELRVGIQTLVDGAALGFTASLWGVAMSLVTNIVERWQERRVVTSVRALQARVDGLFMRRSPEQSLSEIASHTKESREALQVLHEKIGNILQQSIAQVGERTSRAVSEAIQGTLAPIMSELTTQAANQSAEVFKEISSQLTESFQQIGVSLAEQLKASSESLRTTIDHMGEQFAHHADQHLLRMQGVEEASVKAVQDLQSATTKQLDRLQEATAVQMKSVVAATERQMSLLDESLPRVVGSLDRTASLVGAATDGMGDVVTGLARVTTDLTTTSSNLGMMFGTSISALQDLIGTMASAADSVASQQGSINDLADKAVEAVDLLRQASALFSGGFDGMRSSQDHFQAEFRQRMEELARTMSGWLTDYAGQVNQQTSNRMSEWNDHTEHFTSTMVTAAQALSDAVDELGSRRWPPEPPEPPDGVAT